MDTTGIMTRHEASILELLRNIDLFDDFSASELKSLVLLSRLRKYQPGAVIIQEGDFDCWVYFLILGHLEIVKDGRVIGNLRRNGDLFGEMGVIDGSPRSATIRACNASLVMGFDGALIDRKIKSKQINFCYLIYRIFAEVLAVRLRETTRENVSLHTTMHSARGQVEHMLAELEKEKDEVRKLQAELKIEKEQNEKLWRELVKSKKIMKMQQEMMGHGGGANSAQKVDSKSAAS